MFVLQGIDPCRTEGKREKTTGRLYLEERKTFLIGVDMRRPTCDTYPLPA